MTEAALNNVVEWTVSELSSALKRTVEDAYGYVRVRGEISGFKGAAALRPRLFCSQGRRRTARRRHLERHLRPYARQARGGPRRHRDRPADDLSRPFQISDRHRQARACRHRRADEAARGAQEEACRRRAIRRGAQAAPAVSAQSHRRGDFADRCGDPRYSASARGPLSAPGPGVARTRAGRDLRGGSRQRDLQASTNCPSVALCRGRT